MRAIPSVIVSAFALSIIACSPDPVAPVDPVAVDRITDATPAERAATAEPAAAQGRVTLGDGGISLSGAGGASTSLEFGMSKAATLAAMAGQGAVELGRNDECDGGPLEFGDWPNGLRLVFENGLFAGWGIHARDNPDASIKTDRGISTGSTRSDLIAAYPQTSVEDTSFGVQFVTPNIGGLLESHETSARITNLSAGAECTFG